MSQSNLAENLVPGGAAEHDGSYAKPKKVDAVGFLKDAMKSKLEPETLAVPAVPEALAPELATPTPEQEDFAKKFAALSRQQKEVFEQKRLLKEQMDKLDAYHKRQELKSKDPLGYLKEEGLSFDALMQAAMKDGEEATPDSKIKALEDRINKALEDREEEKKQAELSKQKEAVDNFKRGLESTIRSDSDRWELILNSEEGFDTVFSVIEKNFRDTGEIMSVEDASDLVEDHFLKVAQKLFSLKKLSSANDLTAEKDKQQNIEVKTAEPKANPFAPTLNQSHTPATSAPKSLSLNKEERLKEVSKMLRWT